MGDLRLLQVLNLSVNALSGPIPSELSRLARIERLDLSENGLFGTIPPTLGSLSLLQDLELGQNGLRGSIPSELGNLPNLRLFDASFNNLAGSIPDSLGRLGRLKVLDLGFNTINGAIPPSLGQLGNLQSLDLSYNGLNGPIPPALGNLANLRGLRLESNRLDGPWPPELGRLRLLERLEIGQNQLSGPIPVEIGHMSKLWVLSAHSNDLSGPIPPEIGNLKDLFSVNLNGNLLTGPIPAEIAHAKELSTLQLAENELGGQIPKGLAKHSALHDLRLNDNNLTGPIPPALGANARVNYVYLGGNLLTGCIPSGLLQVRFHDLDRLGLDECEFGLFDLEVEPGVLEPGFAIQRHEYVLRVHSDVAQVALAADGGQARVEFLDGDGLPTIDADPLAPGWQVDLADDVTLLGIRATSVDGSEQAEYSISVRRGFAGRLTVVDNLFVQAPDNEDLKHNIPDLEVDLGGQVVRADFLAHFRATGEIERWGYPTSEVLVLEPGVLTQFYQRGVVDFHNLGAGWVVERRLAWDYVGGGSGGSDDLGVEADVLNPNAGTVSGPWGHKVSNFAIDGTVVGFADFFQRLGGVAAFGYPKTDARVDVVAVGRLRDPATTPGFIRQYYQGGVIEFHAEDEQNPVKLSLLGDTVRAQLVPDWQEEAGFARAERLDGGDEYVAGVVAD